MPPNKSLANLPVITYEKDDNGNYFKVTTTRQLINPDNDILAAQKILDDAVAVKEEVLNKAISISQINQVSAQAQA